MRKTKTRFKSCKTNLWLCHSLGNGEMLMRATFDGISCDLGFSKMGIAGKSRPQTNIFHEKPWEFGKLEVFLHLFTSSTEERKQQIIFNNLIH